MKIALAQKMPFIDKICKKQRDFKRERHAKKVEKTIFFYPCSQFAVGKVDEIGQLG